MAAEEVAAEEPGVGPSGEGGEGLVRSPASGEAIIILDPIVVGATRIGLNPFDLPVAIDIIGAPQIQDQAPQVRVSEVLNRVPGTVVTHRGSFAQEEQIMIRGFGGRSQFGTRGVKLIADGIPASTPDGQGGPGLFDLGSARDIEVMRGAFSALYGNHAGGVVQILTEDGPPRPTVSVRAMGGSDATWIQGVKLGGEVGSLNAILDTYRFETDGYRDWSNARKEQLNAKVRWRLESGADVSLVVNQLNQPQSLDPLGLSAEQVAENRRQAQPVARTFRTGRSLDNLQAGLRYEQSVSARDSLQIVGYVGSRSNEQFLAIPLGAQNAITASGGVSAFDRHFHGGSLWWSHENTLAGGPLSLILGGEYETAQEDRKGYRNDLGVRGALKRDEANQVTSRGLFVQSLWRFAPRWSFDSGVRYTQVVFDSRDRFICTPEWVTAPGMGPDRCSGSTQPITQTNLNPDDSGRRTYDAWTPVLGLVYRATPSMNLYANLGRTFETPTFGELAYRPDGRPGLNLGLRPALSQHYEVGMKLTMGSDSLLNLAVFRIDTDDELTVATNQGGRATYQNAPASRRQGAELRFDTAWAQGFAATLAATYIDARFTAAFPTCTGTPCRTLPPLLNQAEVRSGNRIPGVPPYTLFGELSYAHEPTGFMGALDVYAQGKVDVDDLNSAFAGAYWTLNLRGGFRQHWGPWEVSQFLRVENLLDRDYIGAVITNDINGRSFAPAAGTTVLFGLTASYVF
ncbi:TonB-dependent receptor [Thiocapsa imhoffii]|uniref:TonB-dependent receptor n=2 Tax=Thiocapsa imhoffii TaxID=382777 RepID=A0A9X0WKB7_9GAMM|nr:TonB-dependent receptor [Thiocapsa imhoffii]